MRRILLKIGAKSSIAGWILAIDSQPQYIDVKWQEKLKDDGRRLTLYIFLRQYVVDLEKLGNIRHVLIDLIEN